MFNALDAVGMVYGRHGDGPLVFLGSCFSLRDSQTMLTAAHCVAGMEPAHLYVQVPKVIVMRRPEDPDNEGNVAVSDVIRHPEADLALLRLQIMEWAVEPFWNALTIHGLGEELMAYGYPEDVRSDDRDPTARLFRGYVQRVYSHNSRHLPYRYTALELDFACPAGLSGGPLFRVAAPQMVLGMACENFESTTVLEAFEEKVGPSETQRTHYQRVLSYGTALYLTSVQDWLDDHLTPFDSSAWVERQRRRADS